MHAIKRWLSRSFFTIMFLNTKHTIKVIQNTNQHTNSQLLRIKYVPSFRRPTDFHKLSLNNVKTTSCENICRSRWKQQKYGGESTLLYKKELQSFLNSLPRIIHLHPHMTVELHSLLACYFYSINSVSIKI